MEAFIIACFWKASRERRSGIPSLLVRLPTYLDNPAGVEPASSKGCIDLLPEPEAAGIEPAPLPKQYAERDLGCQQPLCHHNNIMKRLVNWKNQLTQMSYMLLYGYVASISYLPDGSEDRQGQEDGSG